MADRSVSHRVARIEPQQIRRLFDLASEHAVDDSRTRRTRFSHAGHVVGAAATATRDGETNYTPDAGIDPFRRAIVDRLRASGVAADSDRVVVTTGVIEALNC